MEYILTLDVGTTSVKCAVFDENLHQICVRTAEYRLLTPQADVIEVEPETYLQRARDCVRSMSRAAVPTDQIRYIVATTQGETLIPIDKEGNTLTNAIVWLDKRAEKEGAQLAQLYPQDLFYRVTGLPGVDGYTPISKLKHLIDKFENTGQQVEKFLLLEDYLIWKLTGHIVTEKSLISSTGYFDILNECLWEDVLHSAGAKMEQIPEILECGVTVGNVLPEMAAFLGVDPEAIVITGAMDQVCGAISCGNIRDGVLHETTGTAMVLGASSTKPNFDNSFYISIYRHVLPGLYLLIPICRTAAIIQKWFSDQFCREERSIAALRGISVYDYLSDLAQQAKAEDTPILLPYFNGSLAPHSIDNARGAFWNIGLDTTKSHFIRAIPEGIAFMLKENIEMLTKTGMDIRFLYSLGGPSKNPFWCQLKADITGKTVILAPVLESTSFGAACLAAVAAGFVSDLTEAAQRYKNYVEYSPNAETMKTYSAKYEQYQKLMRCAAQFYN